MGRRSDHSREQLGQLILDAGHRQLAEHGFAGFSARGVARAIGYSVGTIYNVFPSLDHLLIAINTRTFEQWAEHLLSALRQSDGDRIRSLVEGYFSFARHNPNLWTAIYDHRLPPGISLSAADVERRAALTRIVVEEVARDIGETPFDHLQRLARSLVATVHGHCAFDLSGSFELMGEREPVQLALDRVRQALAAECARAPAIP
ncbi:MAG: TetR/AcrR family transcriptional regulator [Pseudomonadota bacterium]|nr:TetR/AcrR family transcriptional regulator [Pseudomonadota bacterium]